MRRSLVLLAALTILAMIPAQAHAQRRGRGTVNTPFGQFNMNDMKAAGGDPFTAEAMREQKQMMLYQQQMLKQQQQMAKQLKAQQGGQKSNGQASKKAATASTASTPKSAATKAQSKTAKTKPSTPTLLDSTGPKTASHVPGAPTN